MYKYLNHFITLHKNECNSKFINMRRQCIYRLAIVNMGLLPDAQNCGLPMHRQNWERFSRHLAHVAVYVNNHSKHSYFIVKAC